MIIWALTSDQAYEEENCYATRDEAIEEAVRILNEWKDDPQYGGHPECVTVCVTPHGRVASRPRVFLGSNRGIPNV